MTVRRTFAADPSLQFRRHPTFPIRRATFLRFAVLSKRRMAFLLSKSASLSRFQIHSQPSKGLGPFLPHRQFHIELGAREKALLEEDPALKKFKSYKKSVWRLKRVGDFLTIVVVAGCCYEIYVKTVMKKAALQEAQAKNDQA